MTAEWFTVREIAQLRSFGLPTSKRRIYEWAKSERWQAQVDRNGQPLARKRHGRGGGIEYHVSILPCPILDHFIRSADVGETPSASSVDFTAYGLRWAWFAEQKAAAKDVARRRARLLAKVDWLVLHGWTVGSALSLVSHHEGPSKRAIANWRRAVAGVPAAHRVPFLTPQSGRAYGTRLEREAHRSVSSALRGLSPQERRRVLLDVAVLGGNRW